MVELNRRSFLKTALDAALIANIGFVTRVGAPRYEIKDPLLEKLEQDAAQFYLLPSCHPVQHFIN